MRGQPWLRNVDEFQVPSTVTAEYFPSAEISFRLSIVSTLQSVCCWPYYMVCRSNYLSVSLYFVFWSPVAITGLLFFALAKSRVAIYLVETRRHSAQCYATLKVTQCRYQQATGKPTSAQIFSHSAVTSFPKLHFHFSRQFSDGLAIILTITVTGSRSKITSRQKFIFSGSST